jgi:hypothetical protein
VVRSAPAHAQNGTLTRSFVSSAGLDSNACTITAPCATFAVAYTKIGANGIIAALDPGKYGPLTISGPVTINGNGWAAITAPANGFGIFINSNTTGAVVLNGLEVDGAQMGLECIAENSGAGSLTISNTVVRNCLYDGIALNATGNIKLTILNTISSNNGHNGIVLAENGYATTGEIVQSTTDENGIDGVMVSSGQVMIVSSTSNNNTNDGFSAATVGVIITARDSTASNNSNAGFHANEGIIMLAHSVATLNKYGVQNTGSLPIGTIYSFGDNHIGENYGNDISGSLNTGEYHL